jgi:hypothetical protein
MLAGDISTTDEMHQLMLAMNNRIYNDLYRDESIYDTVMNYKWTIEKFMSTYKDFGSDVNGDGTLDTIGYVYDCHSAFYYFISSNIDTMKYDEETGKVSMDNLLSERSISLVDKLSEMFGNTNDTLMHGTSSFSYLESFIRFSAGDVFFIISNAYNYFNNMVDSKDEIMFLPFPMYDEDQGAYYSTQTHVAPVIAIPKTNINFVEDIGLVLEAMAYYSGPLNEAVYEEMIQFRMPQTPEARELLILIYNSRKYDLNYIMPSNFKDTLYTLLTGQILNVYPSYIRKYVSSMCLNMEKALEDY